MRHPSPASAESEAILTIPNVITFVRLASIPVFVLLGLNKDTLVAAFVLGGIAASTDIIDGMVARRLGQVSKLGAAMDPLVDRLLIAGAAVVMIARDYTPLWAVLLVVVRDGVVVAAIPLLFSRGVARPPVSRTGKLATLGIMWGFGLMIGSHMGDPPWTAMRVVAWTFYVPGVALSYAATIGYAGEARRRLRERAGP